MSLAEEHGGSKRDAGRKPSGRRAQTPKTPRGEDPRFEEFLQKQFAQLKRELAEHAPFDAAKQGKVLSFEDRISRPKKNRGGWTVGIAAVVLAAVAVPMVIQLNRQKVEVRAAAGEPTVAKDNATYDNKSPATNSRNDKSAKLDDLEERDGTYYKNAPAKAKSKASAHDLRPEDERNLKATREEASPKDAIAMDKTETKTATNAVRDGDADRFAAKKESARGYAMADEKPAAAPAAPAAAPAPQLAKSRSAPANEISGGDRGAVAQAEMPAPASEAQATSRSIQVDDAKQRLKHQQNTEDEKAEMEKLWREFEKNPQEFNRSKTKRSRLDTLLARHDRKSRAKRMRAIETQKAY
jgi:hypothetical protein